MSDYECGSRKISWASVLMSAFAGVPKVKTFKLSVIFYMQLESIRNMVICNNNNNNDNASLHPLQKFELMKPEC